MSTGSVSRLPATAQDRVLAALVLATGVLGVHGTIEWFDRVHRIADTPHYPGLLTLRIAALLAAAAALACAWRRRTQLTRGGTGSVGFALRGLGAGLLLSWAAGSVAYAFVATDKTTVASAFWSVLVTFVAGWTVYALLAPERMFQARERWLDALSWNLLLALLCAELVVNTWAWMHPSPFLWDESSIEESVRARRLAPGSLYLGFPVNGDGYYDESFAPAEARDARVVAVLADSFGVGVVPHDRNFTTVAEAALAERLPDVPVALHNFGITGIGMPEYAWLLERELPDVSPEVVLLCVFVGNDLVSHAPRRGGYYAFQRFTTWEVLRRVAGVVGSVAEGGVVGAARLEAEAMTEIPEAGKEVPSFDEEAFLHIEQDRMQVTARNDAEVDAMYERFLGALTSMHRAAGERLRLVLIPDEFQVDDALWRELTTRTGGNANAFERDLPQRRLRAWCDANAVACLDLLPALREGQAVAPVYHLRDTHWNARGNRIAGEAIARFLAPALESRP